MRDWACCCFPLGPSPWLFCSRCLREPALIIALLVELPLGIADLVGLLEQKALGGDAQGDHQHDEDENEEQGEHEVLLLVGGLPHRPSSGLLRHVTFTVKLGLGEV